MKSKVKFGISQIKMKPPLWLEITLKVSILAGGFLISPIVMGMPVEILSNFYKTVILSICGSFVTFLQVLCYLFGVETEEVYSKPERVKDTGLEKYAYDLGFEDGKAGNKMAFPNSINYLNGYNNGKRQTN